MDLKLFNTMGRELQTFKPVQPNKVGIYACGPTVYNNAHVGNLRTFIMVDILRRVMELAGYEVKLVMNITDVGHLSSDADDGEDKMEASAREKKMTVWDIAEYYTKAFFDDTSSLNIIKPSVTCKATDHIDSMINLVKRLEEKGFTYEAGGNVYFDISKFPDYGKLAKLNLDDLQAGSRIVVDKYKKNPHDFVLWFTQSKYENHAMLWDSPWGKGYPGWHIECSAMSMEYLGDTFDIHCGGIDLIPVHHTNEIAQSEAATGVKWVNYWVHGEFLVTPKGKMSKSTGDFMTIKGLIEQGFDPLDYRYFCLTGHYSSQLQFSLDAMESAQNARKSLMQKIQTMREKTGGFPQGFNGDLSAHYNSFVENAMNNLNMPRCLGDMWNLIRDDSISDEEKLYTIKKMDAVFGLSLDKEPVKLDLDGEIQKLVDDRTTARKNKDWARADEIRDKLLDMGIVLEDTPQGVRWKKK
ncbi:MAG: cysteine--tRNA ligase [Spirochaetales bacterium]|nr:cysteine--tRNA ligase [Spirochaetales bacterium]